MVVKHLGDNEWEGESTDTKPTNATLGARFTEKDTHTEWFHIGGGSWVVASGGVWNPNLAESITNKTISGETNTFPFLGRPTVKWSIYLSGVVVKARNNILGTIPHTDTSGNLDTVLDAILDAVSPAGTPTSIELGEGDFKIASSFLCDSTKAPGNIRIKGQGIGLTNLILQSTITGTNRGLEFSGSMGGTRLLTANASRGKNNVSVSTADSAGFAVGDHVMLKSAALWDATNGTANQGEIHKVQAVNTGIGVVTFDEPIFDNYTTANGGNIAKLTMLQNITLEDLTVRTVSSGYTATGALLRFYLIDNLILKNVEMRDNVGEASSGFSIVSVINSNFDVMCTRTTAYAYQPLPAVGQYGVFLGGACQHVMVYARGKGIFRHLVTIGSNSGIASSGICRDITISGKGESGKNMLFDTHHDGDGIVFQNCSMMGSTHDDDPTYISGLIQVRSKNNLITGCNARQGAKGILVGAGSFNTVITGCLLHKIRSFTDGTKGEAIHITDAVGTVISGCEIVDCSGLYSIYGEGGNDDTVISGCVIRNSKPIRFVNAVDVVVSGNRIENGAEAAIVMAGTSDWWTIVGNSARGSAASTFVGSNNVKASNINL